jgi:hypothetical protein
LGSFGTAATNGLLCQSRVIIMMKKLAEWLAGEAEVLRENLPQCRFVHHKPHMLPGREPGPQRWESSVYQLELRYGPKIIVSLDLIPLPSDLTIISEVFIVLGQRAYLQSQLITTSGNIWQGKKSYNHLTVRKQF